VSDAPWSVVLLGPLLGSLFVLVGMIGAVDLRGWGSALSERNADLLRMRGGRRRRYLRSQRLLGRVVGPLFVLVGLVVTVAPILSRVV
jgi:hypothetical protein